MFSRPFRVRAETSRGPFGWVCLVGGLDGTLRDALFFFPRETNVNTQHALTPKAAIGCFGLGSLPSEPSEPFGWLQSPEIAP